MTNMAPQERIDYALSYVDHVYPEIRRHFDVSTEEVKRQVQIVAEGLARLDQKLDRTATDLRDEMRRGFADTQAI